MCAVPWGVLSTGGCSVPWGISWVPWGNILSTVGGVQYRGGISWVPWGCSVPWRDIMMHVGDIMRTVEGAQYHGGEKSFVIWVPHGTEHPHGTHDMPPHVSWYPPRYSNLKGWYPPTVLNTPQGTHDIPHVHHDIPLRASWYPPRYWTPPTVLKITPHGTHGISHGTEHPHGTQDIYHDIRHGTEQPPRYSRYPPTVPMISPTVLNLVKEGNLNITFWYSVAVAWLG